MPRATKPLRRYTPLRQVSSAKRPRVRRLPVDVAALVRERSGGPCEACGMAPATEKHHRITRKLGGRHRSARRASDRASNLLDLCGVCHVSVTLNPEVARSYGYSLLERQEPTAEPVFYRGKRVYLDDAGGVHAHRNP